MPTTTATDNMDAAALCAILKTGEKTPEDLKTAARAGKLDAFVVMDAITEYERGRAAAPAQKAVTWNISRKSHVLSVRGLNAKFPVSVYASQWLRLLDRADELRKFIADNFKPGADGKLEPTSAALKAHGYDPAEK